MYQYIRDTFKDVTADSKTSGLFIVTVSAGIVLLFHFLSLLLMLSNLYKLTMFPFFDRLRSMIILIQVPFMPALAAAVLYSLGLLIVYQYFIHRDLSHGERGLIRIHVLYLIFILIMAAMWATITIITLLPAK